MLGFAVMLCKKGKYNLCVRFTETCIGSPRAQVTSSLSAQEPPISVLEAGIHYAVQPARGQKTGFYAGAPPQCIGAW